jgi:hypothetical protein
LGTASEFTLVTLLRTYGKRALLHEGEPVLTSDALAEAAPPTLLIATTLSAETLVPTGPLGFRVPVSPASATVTANTVTSKEVVDQYLTSI